MSVRQLLTRVGQGIQAVGHGIQAVVMTPRPCPWCRQEHIPGESFSASYGTYQPFLDGLQGAQAFFLCPACFRIERIAYLRRMYHGREAHRVRANVRRAVAAGQAATLTLEEWLNKLDLYDWLCAYCGGSYEELEHYVPLAYDGEPTADLAYDRGTTVDNCVPACASCNDVKGSKHPEDLISLAPGLQRVRVQQATLEPRTEGGNRLTPLVPDALACEPNNVIPSRPAWRGAS